MAKQPTNRPIVATPRNMRPRSSPNAEINAQKQDEMRYEDKVFERPEVKDVPLRGYEGGGAIKTKRGMKGIGGGRDMIAGAVGDYLGNRLQRRYDAEAMKRATPPLPEEVPVPQFKHGGRVMNPQSYSKKFR